MVHENTGLNPVVVTNQVLGEGKRTINKLALAVCKPEKTAIGWVADAAVLLGESGG